MASPRDKSKKKNWRMPLSRSRKGNEDEQVCNRISRFGLLQRSVSDPGAKTVSSRGPVPRLHSRLGLPGSPTESCGHGICQYFCRPQAPKLLTPLWSASPAPAPLPPPASHVGGTSGLSASHPGRSSQLPSCHFLQDSPHPATLLSTSRQDSAWLFFRGRGISLRFEGSAVKWRFPHSQTCITRRRLRWL